MREQLYLDESDVIAAEKEGVCIRLYNKEGKHVASFLGCSADGNGDITDWDLCLPNGHVCYCGITNNLIASFAEIFGFDKLE